MVYMGLIDERKLWLVGFYSNIVIDFKIFHHHLIYKSSSSKLSFFHQCGMMKLNLISRLEEYWNLMLSQFQLSIFLSHQYGISKLNHISRFKENILKKKMFTHLTQQHDLLQNNIFLDLYIYTHTHFQFFFFPSI